MFNLAHKEHIYGLMKPYARFSGRNDMFRSSVFCERNGFVPVSGRVAADIFAKRRDRSAGAEGAGAALALPLQ